MKYFKYNIIKDTYIDIPDNIEDMIPKDVVTMYSNKLAIYLFVKSIDETITIEYGEVYESDILDRIIYIVEDDIDIDKILHEIGHIMASDTYDDIEYELREYDLQRAIVEMIDDDKERIKAYNNLQLEKDANNWVKEYLRGLLNE
jgi:hypothetical protein